MPFKRWDNVIYTDLNAMETNADEPRQTRYTLTQRKKLKYQTQIKAINYICEIVIGLQYKIVFLEVLFQKLGAFGFS